MNIYTIKTDSSLDVAGLDSYNLRSANHVFRAQIAKPGNDANQARLLTTNEGNFTDGY